MSLSRFAFKAGIYGESRLQKPMSFRWRRKTWSPPQHFLSGSFDHGAARNGPFISGFPRQLVMVLIESDN